MLRRCFAFAIAPQLAVACAVLLFAPYPASAAAADQTTAGPGVSSQNGDSLNEVIVTATRSRETLSHVSMSVQALTAADLETAGAKQFEDVARLSPGLTFNNTFAGGTNIAIRGIASNAGSATTGIYLDDVPIQVRNLGYSATTLFPRIFDLDRVEVLWGPQGTLFGAGSEGGTVRFILPKPSLTELSSYSLGEVSQTQGGGPSYEAAQAIGGPLINDLLGARLSVYYRHDGGYIDRVNAPDVSIVDPTGSLYGASAVLDTTGTAVKNSNYEDAVAYRLAFLIQPTSTLSIAPSMLYQQQRIHDEVGDFWLSGSNVSSNHLVAPLFSENSSYNYNDAPRLNPGDNELYLPSVSVEWHPGKVALYATTSYLLTHKVQTVDSTEGYLQSYYDVVYPTAGERAPDHNVDKDRTFTQEIRLQSDDPDARFTWLGGLFFSRSRQSSEEDIRPNFFDNTCCFFGIPQDTTTPFGASASYYQNIWGAPMLANSTSYYAAFTSVDEQYATFGQVSWKPLPGLSLTAGVRVSRNKFNFSAVFDGPENNLNAPFGSPCPDGLTCTYNDPNGYYAPAYAVGSSGTAETAVTPKYTLSYQINEDNLIYTTASKGYRPGGGELRLPTVCDSELIAMGYTDSSGNAAAPLTYKSDHVWNYEVGSKNQLFDHHLTLDFNAYLIKWTGVQAQIGVPVCGYAFTDNFGSATSKGVDFAMQVRPLDHLTLELSASYNQATFDQQIGNTDGSIVIFRKGESLPQAGAPWNLVLQADYKWHVFSQPLYAHADFSYDTRMRPTGVTEAGTVNYQPLMTPTGPIQQVDLRIGTVFTHLDLSLFVNNLFDKTPLIGLYQPSDPNGIGAAALWQASTVRPRTFGITASARF